MAVSRREKHNHKKQVNGRVGVLWNSRLLHVGRLCRSSGQHVQYWIPASLEFRPRVSKVGEWCRDSALIPFTHH